MSLPIDLVKIESAISEIFSPDFLSIGYDLNYGNIKINVIIGDERYKNQTKEEGISEILALLNLRHSELFEDYEIVVEVFNNDEVIDYIGILKDEREQE